jgi:hypothetical protein
MAFFIVFMIPFFVRCSYLCINSVLIAHTLDEKKKLSGNEKFSFELEFVEYMLVTLKVL